MITRHRTALLAIAALAAGTVTAVLAPSGPAAASTDWAVSLGDSYISGEAGRWAGNTNQSSSEIDALGPTAYYDNNNTSETISGCHRSKSAEIYIGVVNGMNLACSGAKSATQPYSSGNDFKPGLDFYNDGAGHLGQALLLQQFAAGHHVTMVTVSIGGNDFNFASIVQSCVSDFLSSPSWWPDYCNDDSSVTANFTSSNISAVQTKIKNGLLNVRQAMLNDGYADSSYKIVVQTYPSPIPNGTGFRYSQSGYTRQSTGGCGFWNADANWANSTALPTINNTVRNAVTATGLTNTAVMDIANLFVGRRLCENTVYLLEEAGYTSWTQAGAVNVSEWVNQIRTVSTINSDYYIQESLHPNYWGQLATRDCLRQAYNGGAIRGGNCTRSANGLNSNGEPITTLG
jgi:hypothetical protein